MPPDRTVLGKSNFTETSISTKAFCIWRDQSESRVPRRDSRRSANGLLPLRRCGAKSKRSRAIRNAPGAMPYPANGSQRI